MAYVGYSINFVAVGYESINQLQYVTGDILVRLGIAPHHQQRILRQIDVDFPADPMRHTPKSTRSRGRSSSNGYGLQAEFDAHAHSDSFQRTPRSNSRSRRAHIKSDSESDSEEEINSESNSEYDEDSELETESSRGSDRQDWMESEDASVASSVFRENQGLPHVVNGVAVHRTHKQDLRPTLPVVGIFHPSPLSTRLNSPPLEDVAEQSVRWRKPLREKSSTFDVLQSPPSEHHANPASLESRSYKDPTYECVCITVKCSNLGSAMGRITVCVAFSRRVFVSYRHTHTHTHTHTHVVCLCTHIHTQYAYTKTNT
jgi:hypothetical protein